MDDLSPRQTQILEFMITFIDQQGYPPTFRQIATAMGISSTNGVAHHLHALEKRGYLDRDPNGASARSIRLTSKTVGSFREVNTVAVPIVGRVAAGLPLMSEELYEGTLNLDSRLCPVGAKVFALNVRGDSMIEDGILDGDLVIVKQQPTANNNDIVVAIVDGEATVKRLQRRNDRIVLLPANQQMSPIIVPHGSDIHIAGVVVGVYRKLL